MAKIKFGKKAKKAGDKADTPGPSVAMWMATYSDMVTLLLTFFIMLLATMSESTSDSKMQLIATAFVGSFGAMPGGMTLQDSKLVYAGASVQTLPSTEQGFSTAKKTDAASSVLEADIMSDRIRVTEDERGFVISLGADYFFDPSSDVIPNTQENAESFIRLAALLGGLDNEIRIEGHTDAGALVPGGTTALEFGSNWGLSSARAIAVLRKLMENDQVGSINRDQFSIAGFADTRPVASNDTPSGRALNRRVDIIIIRPDISYYNQKN